MDEEALNVTKGNEHPEEFSKPPVDKEAQEKIARALFNPKLLELYPSMRWENLPDDIRESYLERAERLHNCFVELGYHKPKGKPPLLSDGQIIYLTQWIFQYLECSGEAYNNGSLSNQNRAKHIMELVIGSSPSPTR